jgi:TPM domain
MTIFKRLLFFAVLIVPLTIAFIGPQAQAAHAERALPVGSCGDTVSDDAQLFGNKIVDVLNQAKAINDALQADTRVVTVSQDKLAGSSLRDYYYLIQSKCPEWGGQNFAVFIVAKGHDPFLHLGSQFSSKMTTADFQQMTLSIRSELTNGNYTQGTVDLLKQVQKKLSPDYTWLWVSLAVFVVLVVGGILAVVFLRRRQSAAVTTNAQEQETAAKQAAVNVISSSRKKIDELSPRVEVLLALMPAATAAQLRGLFETVKEKEGRVEERLGNLLSSPETSPGGKTSQVEYYRQMQSNYQQVYNEAQEPQYLLQGVETAVGRLEKNPHEQFDFRQLTAPGFPQGSISQPGYPSESSWTGR